VVTASRRFSIGAAIGDGWRAFTANIVPMVLYGLVVLVVSFILDLILGEATGTIRATLTGVVVFVVNQLVTIGWLRIALDIVDGRAVTAERVRESFDILLPFAIAAILFSIMLAVGTALLVVPGIIVAVVFGFYGWILVDGPATQPIEALRRSAEITRGERLHLFAFGVVLLLLNLLGLLVFIVGVLVTSAVTMLAVAHVYRQLDGSADRGMTSATPRD